MIQIIENKYPYFIKFKFEGLEELINYVASLETDPTRSPTNSDFTQGYHTEENARSIISRLPFADKFKWHYTRVSPFITGPGISSRIHKDGDRTRVSFNIPLVILDEDCLTTWYRDEELSDCELSHLYTARIPVNWENKKRKHVMTMVHKPGEMVLFNTDIFHRWDNTKSKNIRSVLTMRLCPSYESDMYFDKVKNILFDNAR